MKKIPFDYEKFKAGMKCVTRDGKEVTEIYKFETALTSSKIIAVIDGNIVPFLESGEFFLNHETYNDLFLIKESKKYYLNFYPDWKDGAVGFLYKTLEEAQSTVGFYGKTIEIEI